MPKPLNVPTLATCPVEPRRPQDLPDFRLWVLEQWRPDRFWTFMAAINRDRDRDLSEHISPLEPRFDRMALAEASLWWVTSDLCTLIGEASKSLPDTTLTEDLLPAATGFVVFESPLWGTDIYTGTTIRIDALLWAKNTLIGNDPCLTISLYARTDDHVSSDRLWAPCGRTDWHFGADLAEVMDPSFKAFPERLTSMEEDRRWFATFCLLTGQKLTETVPAPIPRPIARRSKAQQMSSDVRVIDVRRSAPPTAAPDEHREVNWTHRWIVDGGGKGGFWRQQRCGPNGSERRPVWIFPYIKGPADKPLKVKPSVNIVKG